MCSRRSSPRSGLNARERSFEGDGSYPVDNLFATRTGNGAGPHLLFAGHTDVVPLGDVGAWTHDPFSADIEDGVIWGRGATDMKSGVAAFCAAMAELAPIRCAGWRHHLAGHHQ